MSTAPAATTRHHAAVAYVLLAALSLFWGLNWPVMKVVLGEIAVLPFRALCLIVSGPLLLAIAALRGDRLALKRHEIMPLLLAALLNVTLWHLFSAYGVSLMAAGRASIIAYTMPAWAMLLGALVLGEPFGARGLVALVLGMGGVGAALAVRRHGLSVCMTEETDWIGGQATSGGVSALDENRFIEISGAYARFTDIFGAQVAFGSPHCIGHMLFHDRPYPTAVQSGAGAPSTRPKWGYFIRFPHGACGRRPRR